MEKLKKIIKASIVGVSILLPAFASAQVTGGVIPSGGKINLPLIGGGVFNDVVVYIINILIAIVAVIAVLFLIWGGFRYITSAGNDEIAEGAKKTIQNSIIGLVIVILSYTIITVVSNALFGRH